LADVDRDPLRIAALRRSAEEWALVLASQGIASEIRPERGQWGLWVAGAHAGAASLALERWERENRPAPEPDAAPASGGELGGVWLGAALLLFAAVTGPAARGADWFRAGSAHARVLLGGEPWRALTALTLHVDAAHVVGNALSAAIIATWLCRRLGNGVGLAVLLAAGALGNVLNALWHGGGHRSVGASTALFGALGALSGLEAGRRFWAGVSVERAWLPLAAGLALLAMLGTGRGSDVGAHVFGLLCGACLGLLLARADRPRRSLQRLAGASALAALGAAWWLALSA
jgi:membrane associated rhomboid family serine protease